MFMMIYDLYSVPQIKIHLPSGMYYIFLFKWKNQFSVPTIHIRKVVVGGWSGDADYN
jgi:hypothetical protein